jgi:hypothetical protein
MNATCLDQNIRPIDDQLRAVVDGDGLRALATIMAVFVVSRRADLLPVRAFNR